MLGRLTCGGGVGAGNDRGAGRGVSGMVDGVPKHTDPSHLNGAEYQHQQHGNRDSELDGCGTFSLPSLRWLRVDHSIGA